MYERAVWFFGIGSFSCTYYGETTDVHRMLAGQCLGEWRLEGPFRTGRNSVKRAFVRSLYVARLSEGLMVRVLRNAVSGGNAARQAVRTASSLAISPTLDGR